MTIRGNIVAYFLVNQPEFDGPILWWIEGGAYVAVSGPHLTEQDLIRIANSVSSAAASGASRTSSPAEEAAEGTGAGTASSADTRIGDKGETTPERDVLALFKGDATSDADAKRIIATLPDLNWPVYDEESGRKGMDLLAWLDKRQIDDITEIEYVLWVTTGLDGAHTEGYCSVVGTLFSSDPVKFGKALGTLTEDQADRIMCFVAYYASYERPDIPPAKEQLQSLLHSSTLIAPEAQRAEKLPSAINSPPWE